MRVIVTRPAGQAASWVRSLAGHGVDAVALPLIDIAPPDDVPAVQAAWRTLAAQRLVVFASPNAAQMFFGQRSGGQAWPAATLAGSMGPGTTQVLRELGVPGDAVVEPAHDSPQFDSEALWRRLESHEWQGVSVLVVRGDGGRDWLAERLRECGARVAFIATYRRVAPAFAGESKQLLDAALARPHEHLWFFSSSEAIDHLAQACPNVAWAEARALATHPRIAERARALGFGAVHPCRPTLDAVVACIQSIAS